MTKITGKFVYDTIGREYTKACKLDPDSIGVDWSDWEDIHSTTRFAYEKTAEILNSQFKTVDGYETELIAYNLPGAHVTDNVCMDFKSMLNSLGGKGWKLITSTSIESVLYVFFQRKKRSAEE